MIINHELKIWPCYYKAVESGEKKFEIRDNSDRGFQKGDIVILREYDGGEYGRYTGRCIDIRITYVTNAYQKDGYVVFSFEIISCNSLSDEQAKHLSKTKG